MRSIILLLLTASILLFVTDAVAQSRTISEAELTSVLRAGMAKRKGMSYAVTTQSSGPEAGVSSETMFEYGPDGAYRYVFAKESGGTRSSAEGIVVGPDRYTLGKHGVWAKETPNPADWAKGVGPGTVTATFQRTSTQMKTEYLFLGTETVNGQQTSHYRKVRTVKHTSPKPAYTRRLIDDFWMRSDGLMLKSAHLDITEPTERRYSSETNLEYKDITIKAPVPE